MPLSAATYKVASIAADQIGVPTADWLALAVLAAAADQSGLGPDGPDDAHGQPGDRTEPGGLTDTLARLEAKLDAALASGARADRPAP